MANYKVTRITEPETPTFERFDEILKEDLSRNEVKALLEALRPYLDPNIFEEGNKAFAFIYFPTEPLDVKDLPLPQDAYDNGYRFLITKEK